MLYAGIGSRDSPPEVLSYMAKVAARLAARGYVLRSGAAAGADSAFEGGCTKVGGACEIWLPWKGFNSHVDTGLYPTNEHFKVAESLHPAWAKLGRGPRALHARNVGQILGADLQTPVNFVLCWTRDGCESSAQRTSSTGGTGTAIELASRNGIAVINLANEGAKERLAALVLGQLAQAAPTEAASSDRPRH